MTKSTRRPNQLRPVKIERFKTAAPGSVVITAGNTRVLCTASIETDLPKWMLPPREPDPNFKPKGWVTAEYAMLPGSTLQRKKRGPDSRATEIQRLIGRALRASVNLYKMPGLAITCDCDVLTADGGTRTASITGAWVALALAIRHAQKQKIISQNPMLGNLAAVSVGIIDGTPWLDLDYELDVRADVDMNVAMNHKDEFVEVQGTGEAGTFTRKQLDTMLALAGGGIRKLIAIQKAAIRE
jgi:ribonuclease PH